MIIVGFDWARDKHDVCIQDSEGETVHEQTVGHDAGELEQLRFSIAQLEPNPSAVHVALEQHDGALLAWLLHAGYTVYGINPKSADRARDVFRPAGAKDDRNDALVAADLLRANLRRFKPMHAQSDETLQLRSLSRLRMRLSAQKTTLMQRLRTIQAEWCPHVSRLCNDFNRKWQRALLRRWPLHEDLAAAHGNSLNSFFSGHRICGKTREKVRDVRQTETVFIPEGRKDALRMEIDLILEQLDLLIKRLACLDRELEEAWVEHPSYGIFNSLPVKGLATLSMIAAGFGDRRDNPTGWQDLAARWGVAPVTVASGKSKKVKRRRACDHHMLQALCDYSFATAFSVSDCWASEYYQKKRSENHDHYEALRAVGLKWVKIMWAIWHNDRTYSEEYHQARRRAAQPEKQPSA